MSRRHSHSSKIILSQLFAVLLISEFILTSFVLLSPSSCYVDLFYSPNIKSQFSQLYQSCLTFSSCDHYHTDGCSTYRTVQCSYVTRMHALEKNSGPHGNLSDPGSSLSALGTICTYVLIMNCTYPYLYP